MKVRFKTLAEMPVHKARKRIVYLIAGMCVIVLGLASRHIHGLFPGFLGKYPGDALWTLMMFFGLGCLWSRESALRIASYALMVSYLIEFTQLYQSPWINAIRATALGHLVLGSGFGWFDFLAYSVGAGAGLAAGLLFDLYEKSSKRAAIGVVI